MCLSDGLEDWSPKTMAILGMRPTANKLHHLLATGQEVKLTRISFWMADKLNWWYQVAGPSQWHHPSLWLLLVKVFLSYYVLLCHLPPLLHLQQCRCASYYFFEVISKHQHLLLLLASSSTLAYNRLILDEHIIKCIPFRLGVLVVWCCGTRLRCQKNKKYLREPFY